METKILYLLHLVIALCISTPVLAQITVSRSAKQRLNGQEKDSNQQSGLYFEHTDVQFPLLEENSEPYVAYYSYINRATTSICITRVEASCGCMDVSYDSKPVLPGGKGTIQVTFKPKGYSGTIYREIFVYTTQSDEVPSACLGLNGTIKPSDDPWYTYHHHLGAIRARQSTVTFRIPKGHKNQLAEAIACGNSGTTTLKIAAEGLPPYLTFHTLPAEISPGAEADLIFVLDCNKLPDLIKKETISLPVTLTGVEGTDGLKAEIYVILTFN